MFAGLAAVSSTSAREAILCASGVPSKQPKLNMGIVNQQPPLAYQGFKGNEGWFDPADPKKVAEVCLQAV